MSAAGALLRRVNRTVRPLGLEVRRVRRDLDSCLAGPRAVRAMLRDTAEVIGDFLARACLLPCSPPADLEAALAAFYAAYQDSPVRAVTGGARLNKLLWLFALARGMAPEVVVESGTFRGTSAWAMAQGAPGAVIHTFDIEDAGIAARAPNVRYHRGDWAGADLGPLQAERTLAFFDDHVDQARRVLEAQARGLRWLVFDDDLDVRAFPRHCADAGPLPKIAMVLDRTLGDGEVLEWRFAGRPCRYVVDGAYHARARAAIAATQRLPDLSSVTGLEHEEPLTIVALRPLDEAAVSP